MMARASVGVVALLSVLRLAICVPLPAQLRGFSTRVQEQSKDQVVGEQGEIKITPAPDCDTPPFRPGQPTASLLELIEASLGPARRQATEEVLPENVALLETMFATLPKNRNGGVDLAVAKYALNRLFVQRDNWRVRGLAPAGTAWSNESSLLVVGSRMPHNIQLYIQKRLDSIGLDLNDLATLAATIKLLIRDDSLDQLQAAYRLSGKKTSQPLTTIEATGVVRLYMRCYCTGNNVSQLSSRDEADSFRDLFDDEELGDDSFFLGKLKHAAQTAMFDYAAMKGIIDEAIAHHRKFTDDERAAVLKNDLMSVSSSSSSGRISLKEFYASRFTKGIEEFTERKDFLRQLGALDESDPTEPRVIIPNYLFTPLNCAGPWSYYAICVVSECEQILGELEKDIGTPTSSPEAIVVVVSHLSSSSMVAPRELSNGLVAKLHGVAQHHGGKVPLHGRLFLQWMHFAYPVECPYPFLEGTVQPMTKEEFFENTGKTAELSDEELEEIVKGAGEVKPLNCDDDAEVCMGMWTPLEELLAVHNDEL